MLVSEQYQQSRHLSQFLALQAILDYIFSIRRSKEWLIPHLHFLLFFRLLGKSLENQTARRIAVESTTKMSPNVNRTLQ